MTDGAVVSLIHQQSQSRRRLLRRRVTVIVAPLWEPPVQQVERAQYCGSVIRRPQHAGHGGDHDGHSMPSSGHPLPELPRARAAPGQIGPNTGWAG